MRRNIAIVLAGGRGSRMKSDIPKQYMMVNKKPLLYYSLKTFQDSFTDEIVLVCQEADIEFVRKEIVDKYDFNKVTTITAGGKERWNSVYNGLLAIYEKYGIADANVFIHDGARPCVDQEILNRALDNVTRYKACVAAVPVKDTIKVVAEDKTAVSTPDRRMLWQIQTPQVFDYKLVWDAYSALEQCKNAVTVTDDAMVVESFTDAKVYMSEGSYLNIKVTTPEDILIAEIFLNKN
ncbi:MAG: 2-C-methyl-D-erythritol 4-phosphate cytidylyltransferase [Bacteroides sp.]